MDKQKIALVTGANKGIGFEIARQLGEKEIVVLLGVRDQKKGQEAVEKLRSQKIDADVVIMDVTKQESITKAAKTIEETYGRLDILVNNAGISREKGFKPSETPLEVMKETYETNVFAVVAVINTMLPLLRKSTAAHIVNQSSSMGSLQFAADPDSQYAKLNLLAYDSSKTALNSITLEYAKELRGTKIKINSSCPGYVATDLNQHRGYRTPEQGAKAAVILATLPEDGPSGGFFDEKGQVPW